MTTSRSASPDASPLSMLLDQRKISRRSVLQNIVGLALAGASITPLAATCGSPSPSLGTLLYTYTGQPDGVLAVAWSPDSKRIASASGYNSALITDNKVQVWDAINGGHVLTYRGHSDAVNTVAWSPDGSRIASGSGDILYAGDDHTVQVWDAANGGNVFTYRGHSFGVKAVVWSPDGKRIASAGDGVQVWDAADGGNAYIYYGHGSPPPQGPGPVYAVAWSPDGARIASAGKDKTVQVWRAQ